MTSSLGVRRLSLGPIEANCYLVRLPEEERAVVIDPGAEADRIFDALSEWDAVPEAILLTHAHMDHVGGVADLHERTGAPIYLHPADRRLYDVAAEQARMFGLDMRQPPPPHHELDHGQVVRVAGIDFDVRHAPGHSPGGVVLAADGHAFVGDCVFAGSIGRTDLPGGDTATLLQSIRDQILTLPADTVLHTGHGPDTTVAKEAATNPFLTGSFGWSG